MFIDKYRNSLIIAVVLLTISAGLWYFLSRDDGGMGMTMTAEEYASYDIYGFDYGQSEDEIYPMLEALLDKNHFDLSLALENHDIYVDKNMDDFSSVAKHLSEDQIIREIGYSEVRDEKNQGLNSYWIGYLDKSGNRVSITYYKNGIVNKTVGFIEEGKIVTVSNQLTKDVILMDLKKDNPMFFTESWQAIADKEFVSVDEWAGSGLYFRQVGNQGYCTMMIYGSGVRIMTHFTTPVAINEDGTIRMTLPENLSTGTLSEVEGDPVMVEVVLSLTGESIAFGRLNYTYDSEAHTYDYILEMTE